MYVNLAKKNSSRTKFKKYEEVIGQHTLKFMAGRKESWRDTKII